MNKHLILGMLFTLLILLLASGLAGDEVAVVESDFGPLDFEFQVNSYETGSTLEPVVRRLADGSYVVAWTQGGYPEHFRAQRLSSEGDRVGPELLVATPMDPSAYSVIDTTADAEFLVSWWDQMGDGPLMARRFASDGGDLGESFTITDREKAGRDVAFDSDGSFVFVWHDISGSGIQARRFASDGTPLSEEFPVDDYGSGSVARPRISNDADGNFVVTWTGNMSPGSDSDLQSVQARLFGFDGSAIGSQFQVNTYTTLQQRDPEVSMNAAGEFAIAWRSSDFVNEIIALQRYDSAGTPIGTEFEVTFGMYPPTHLPSHSVEMLDDTSTLVTFHDTRDPNQDDLRMRRIAPDGAAVELPYRVNSIVPGNQTYGETAAEGLDEFLIVWQSVGSYGDDQDGFSIQARKYSSLGTFSAIFSDSFESGDCSLWSSCP